MPNTMRYKDRKIVIEKLAEYFNDYKGIYYYPRFTELSEAEEFDMFSDVWIHEEEAFAKATEMLSLFKAGEPEEASRVYNEFTGRDNTDSISEFYKFIKSRFL